MPHCFHGRAVLKPNKLSPCSAQRRPSGSVARCGPAGCGPSGAGTDSGRGRVPEISKERFVPKRAIYMGTNDSRSLYVLRLNVEAFNAEAFSGQVPIKQI